MEHPKTGLIPPKKEYIGKRNFSYPEYFGAPAIVDVPDFQIGIPRVKNQGNDSTCVVFAATSVSEDQEGLELEPAYQWLKTAQLGGVYPQGSSPDDVCKSLTKFGSLSVATSPLHLPQDRAAVVQIKQNWDKIDNLDSVAFMYRKRSWFELEGSGDRFDSLRQILYARKAENITAVCGLYWQPAWTYAPGGICEHYGPDKNLPHAFKIFGQKTINGVPYLMVQNSWGQNVGDRGIYLFSREVVNSLMFARGFFDVSPEAVKNQTWSWLAWAKDWLIKLFSETKQPPKTPPEPPKPVEPIPTPTNMSKLNTFAEAIRVKEGWSANPPSRSFKNSNPGNLRGLNAYTRSLGAIGTDLGNFCKFPSERIGFQALCRFVADSANNLLIGRRDLTILSFIQGVKQPNGSYRYGYAPASDGNNPLAYAEFLASKVGANINSKLKEII